MLDWRFNDYETLPLLVTLLLDKEASRSEATLDEVYNANPNDMALSHWQNKATAPLLKNILKAITNKELKTARLYEVAEINRNNSAQLFLEPVSFFRWVENEGYVLPYRVQETVISRENQFRIKNYTEYRISQDDVSKKMHEPLWDIYVAILYLNGFEPANPTPSYTDKDTNFSIVNSQPNLKQIVEYLNDSANIGEIELYSNSDFRSNKVKPKDFMFWARNLGIDFQNLVLFNEKRSNNKINPKERDTLLKLLLGLALTNYEYNPQASRNATAKEIASDLALHGLQIDEDTVRKWLNQSKEQLPDDWKPHN